MSCHALTKHSVWLVKSKKYCLLSPQATEAAFERGVELLCKSHVAQKADIAPEMQLIRASAAIGLYLKNSYPEMKENVKTALASFLNRRVGKWITEKGGWVSKLLRFRSLQI